MTRKIKSKIGKLQITAMLDGKRIYKEEGKPEKVTPNFIKFTKQKF